jgi:transitional endoplasmic reticulum ATPase
MLIVATEQITPEEKARLEKLNLIDVIRHPGKNIALPPPPFTFDDGIQVLTRLRDQDNQVVSIEERIYAMPYDAAMAFQKVMEAEYGVVFAEATPNPNWFKPDTPPQVVSVESGYKKTVTVRLGRFHIPGIRPITWGPKGQDGNYLTVDVGADGPRHLLKIVGVFQRKYEVVVRELARKVRDYVNEHSLYRGQAFRIKFQTKARQNIFGEAFYDLPAIRFLDLTRTRPEEMIFPRELEKLIEVNLWTPIRYPDLVQSRLLQVPIKRGAMLSGPYGTGKTLLAYVTAGIAVENNWTFVYLEDVLQLPEAIQLATQQFGRTVIFAEDLDKAGDDPDNKISNALDGLDSKESEIMVIVTTNHIDNVPQILKRPGRFDCILPIDQPDAEAQERLIQVYGRGLIEAGTDLGPVARLLASDKVIPAVTREVVERSKLSFVARDPQGAGQGLVLITGDDLFWAAKTMKAQNDMLREREDEDKSLWDLFGDALHETVRDATDEILEERELGERPESVGL